MLVTFAKRSMIALFVLVCVDVAGVYHGRAMAQTAAPVQTVKAARYRGDIVLVRGGFNVFSRGLDRMAAKLRARGVPVKVINHSFDKRTANAIIASQKANGRRPVVLIGHSWGANSVIHMANQLRAAKVTVDYMVSFAPTNPPPTPPNVKRHTNYYFSGDGWGKPVRKGRGFRGRLRNVDLSGKGGLNHFNLEKNDKLQKDVIATILRILRRSRSS